MAKYKVGDKVRIVNNRPSDPSFTEEMTQHLGKVLKISEVRTNRYGDAEYYFREARFPYPASVLMGLLEIPGWAFREEWIQGLAEDSVGSPISIHIRFDGDVTTADLVKGGKVVKTATAKRNPADPYRMSEGAKIAVDRLFSKKKPDKAPKVGDKYVIIGHSGNIIHYFQVGEIVRVATIGTTSSYYVNKDGKGQYVSAEDVKPYKG